MNSAKKQDVIADGGENLEELRYLFSDQGSDLRAVRRTGDGCSGAPAPPRYTLAIG